MKNLSKEYKEVMAEAKELVLTSAMSSSVFNTDAENLTADIKAMLLLNRFIDLCGDMLEKQEQLMDKMDKVMDKYLEK